MKLSIKQFLLPILFLAIVTFSQCGLIIVGAGVFGASKAIGNKMKTPSTDYEQVDTVYEDVEIAVEEEIVEAPVEAEEEIEDVAIEEATEVEDLPKSDTNKVDRSIFPEDVLGGDDANNANLTQLKIFEEEFDMGTIVYGDSVKHTFRYQNVGAKDFVMEQYTVGCGCTEVSKPKKTLKPGEMGEITLQFNSKEKDGPGDYTSDAMILGNTPEGFVEFKIKIKVVEKE